MSAGRLQAAGSGGAAATSPLAALVLSRLPASLRAASERYPSTWLVARVLVALLAFVAIDRAVARLALLPAPAYAEPVLAVEILLRPGPVLLAVLAVLVGALARYGRLLARWSDFDHGARMRALVVFLALAMAWPFATFGYNHYFDQGYYLDRLALVALVAALWWRPVFIFPFVLLAYALMGQVAQPALGGSVFAHKLQVLHVLNLFAATLVLHAFSASRRSDTFWLLLCCLVAGAYWEAALAKWQLGWLSFGNLYQMPLAAYGHGWLAFVDADALVDFASALRVLDWPARIGVLAIESAALLFLWRRGVSVVLLIAYIVFHVGVFAAYRFLFWPWMALDAALLVVLWNDRRARELGIYTRRHFALSVLLVASAGVWAEPPHLGWFDTRVSHAYRLEALGESGRRYRLTPAYFSPYDEIFTMTSFAYLSEHPVLVAPYGVTKSRALAEALERATTGEEVLALERESGRSRYDAARAAAWQDFVRRFVANRNASGERLAALGAVRPPPQFWSFAGADAYSGQERLREVVVHERTLFFDGNRLQVVRDAVLARLPIPAAGGEAQ